MSAELIGILGVGATLLVGLGGLLLALWARTDKRLDSLELELRRLGERVARIEGLLKGTRRHLPLDAPAPAGD